ncbi:MAG: SAM-dependent chlorinase/fluorinase [Methylococcaceae bacterium]|nr:SAM-dependent chlorinase/fluorinase [Methylococcaceae bacterium]
MIFLFTDFGAEGPYLGQMEAVLRLAAPGVDVINLASNAPPGEPRLAAYVLAALAKRLPENSVFVCVVDPGVGGTRHPLVLEADERWFIGPDNGLLNAVAVQAKDVAWKIIDWRPEQLSASFHGRDLFAPIAAQIARQDFAWPHRRWPGPDLDGWPADIAAIVYFDHYGNAFTGWRYAQALDGKTLLVNGRRIPQARTFCDSARDLPFWYCNSLGLIEIAVNLNRADLALGLSLGMGLRFED